MCTSRIGVFGEAQGIQTDEGGEWQNEVWPDFRSDPRIELQFQGVGAHTWILERRKGVARGVYDRSVADGHFSGEQIFAEAQCSLANLISGGWFLDWFWNQPGGSNPADLF